MNSLFGEKPLISSGVDKLEIYEVNAHGATFHFTKTMVKTPWFPVKMLGSQLWISSSIETWVSLALGTWGTWNNQGEFFHMHTYVYILHIHMHGAVFKTFVITFYWSVRRDSQFIDNMRIQMLGSISTSHHSQPTIINYIPIKVHGILNLMMVKTPWN